MNFDMTRPCDSCPFCPGRFDGLRKGRVIEIVEGLQAGAHFPCHKTVDHDNENEPLPDSGSFCAGAMIMLEKAQDPEQAPHNHALRIAERLGFYDHTKLDLTAPVFASFEQMIEEAQS